MKSSRQNAPSKTPPSSASQPAQDGEVVRDADGLVIDEYSDASFVSEGHMDALDRTDALDDSAILADVADDTDGIAEMEIVDQIAKDGADADMGLGVEALSADDLEDAAIGHELKGAAGVTRDDEVHGERMFDSPDGKGRDVPTDIPTDDPTEESDDEQD